MLEVRELVAGYGVVPVLRGVSLRVGPGEMVALVGANGAGKSTLLKAVSGIVEPRSGHIALGGASLERMTPVARVRSGLAHVPEGRQIFGNLSVAENLVLGAYGVTAALRSRVPARLDAAYAMFPILDEKRRASASSLSGGQQQMLAIARGLMLEPRVLLLDEPSLGLSPLAVSDIFGILRTLRSSGVSILLAEQNARLSLAIADRAYVMEAGRIVHSGSGAQLLASSEIVEKYLGVGTDAGALEANANVDRLARGLRETLATARAR